MASIHNEPNVKSKPPLDDKFYSLDPDELQFFKSHTGITDEATLKEHILTVQAEAYEIYAYPCIRRFSFTKLKISRLPAYKHVLALGRERQGALLLDIGCCFGNDVRKAVADGYPIQNVIASDLRKEFWDLGHKLFKSTPESFPVVFVAGDAFDPSHLAPRSPVLELPQGLPPLLTSVMSLNPLQGHISAIHASSLFHLFSEEKQQQLARAIATLLSPLPGSVIFGAHVGKQVKGFGTEESTGRHFMFCHSPDSWRELWREVFPQGAIQVDAGLKQMPTNDSAFPQFSGRCILWWSVTRL